MGISPNIAFTAAISDGTDELNVVRKAGASGMSVSRYGFSNGSSTKGTEPCASFSRNGRTSLRSAETDANDAATIAEHEFISPAVASSAEKGREVSSGITRPL